MGPADCIATILQFAGWSYSSFHRFGGIHGGVVGEAIGEEREAQS